MADEKVKWDVWSKVEEALRREAITTKKGGDKKSAATSEEKPPHVTIVCIAHAWSPTALHVAKEVSSFIASLRSSSLISDSYDDH
jgi:hypothetical protein